MSIRLQNARLVDKNGERAGSLLLSDGLIVSDDGRQAETVDCGGLVLMPGFVDTHCHLRDPGFPQKETMETGMRAALAGGYTTVCAMANTDPVIETPALVTANLIKAEALGLCRLIQAAAAGEGLSDERATDRKALAKVTGVLSNDGRTIVSDAFMRALLEDSARYGFLVSTHCQPERATVARDLRLLRETGGRLHVGHISRRETAAMLREAKAAGLPVTAEVMPHHLFCWDDPYRVNPPIRTKADADALIEAILDGTADCLATDHAPHTEADKAAGMAGISNIEHAAAIFHTVLIPRGLTLPQLSKLMSDTPARLLGLGGATLDGGMRADLVLFDPDEAWTVHRSEMLSRSHNTPFEGRRLNGRVKMTIAGGMIRYDHRQTL